MTFQEFVNKILGFIIVAGGALGVWLLGLVGKLISNKISEFQAYIAENLEENNMQRFDNVVEFLTDYVLNVVKELNNTLKKQMIDATSDGKLTDDDKKTLCETALKTVNAILADFDKYILSQHINDIDKYIVTLIEKFVEEVKPPKVIPSIPAKKTAVKSTPTAPTE